MLWPLLRLHVSVCTNRENIYTLRCWKVTDSVSSIKQPEIGNGAKAEGGLGQVPGPPAVETQGLKANTSVFSKMLRGHLHPI